MAKSLHNFVNLAALLFFFFLIFSTQEMQMAEAKLCERRSKTWPGTCIVSSNCDEKCRFLEGAKSGTCHFQFPGRACFCYFNC